MKTPEFLGEELSEHRFALGGEVFDDEDRHAALRSFAKEKTAKKPRVRRFVVDRVGRVGERFGENARGGPLTFVHPGGQLRTGVDRDLLVRARREHPEADAVFRAKGRKEGLVAKGALLHEEFRWRHELGPVFAAGGPAGVFEELRLEAALLAVEERPQGAASAGGRAAQMRTGLGRAFGGALDEFEVIDHLRLTPFFRRRPVAGDDVARKGARHEGADAVGVADARPRRGDVDDGKGPFHGFRKEGSRAPAIGSRLQRLRNVVGIRRTTRDSCGRRSPLRCAQEAAPSFRRLRAGSFSLRRDSS